MQGREVDYNAPVTLREVQYITFAGNIRPNGITL